MGARHSIPHLYTSSLLHLSICTWGVCILSSTSQEIALLQQRDNNKQTTNWTWIKQIAFKYLYCIGCLHCVLVLDISALVVLDACLTFLLRIRDRLRVNPNVWRRQTITKEARARARRQKKAGLWVIDTYDDRQEALIKIKIEASLPNQKFTDAVWPELWL